LIFYFSISVIAANFNQISIIAFNFDLTMNGQQVQTRLREVEAGLCLNYSVFSEKYCELRRQERVFRTLYINAKETARKLFQLKKITEDDLIRKLQTINIIRNNMKREYKNQNDFFGNDEMYEGRRDNDIRGIYNNCHYNGNYNSGQRRIRLHPYRRY
jgi:hypothetical protein